jgi:hypothetical protein
MSVRGEILHEVGSPRNCTFHLCTFDEGVTYMHYLSGFVAFNVVKERYCRK